MLSLCAAEESVVPLHRQASAAPSGTHRSEAAGSEPMAGDGGFMVVMAMKMVKNKEFIVVIMHSHYQ